MQSAPKEKYDECDEQIIFTHIFKKNIQVQKFFPCRRQGLFPNLKFYFVVQIWAITNF